MRKCLILVLGFLLSVPINTAIADTANPPQIVALQVVDQKNSYMVGDKITFSISYSGGHPGISLATVSFSSKLSGECIGTSNIANWYRDSATNEFFQNYGPISATSILVYATINSGCQKGLNVFNASVGLKDRTELSVYKDFSNVSFNVNDGEHIPVGSIISGDPVDPVVEFASINQSYFLESTDTIELPRKSNEGLLVHYQTSSTSCSLKYEYEGQNIYSGQISNVVSLNTLGKCTLSALIYIPRSKYRQYTKKISFDVISKAAADKAAADKDEIRILLDSVAGQISSLRLSIGENNVRVQQATLDRLNLAFQVSAASGYPEILRLAQKTQADLLALEQAFAKEKKTLKKSTITCVKGKLTKKVDAVNPKCPAGFKKR